LKFNFVGAVIVLPLSKCTTKNFWCLEDLFYYSTLGLLRQDKKIPALKSAGIFITNTNAKTFVDRADR
jgi:hypothetical protein